MTEHHYKLLVTDIDGTLINQAGDVSVENREALALAIDSGMYVSLSTGRSLKSSVHILDQLSLDNYHIFFDGALVSTPDPDEEIYVRHIDRSIVRQMIEFAHMYDIDLELFSATHYFAKRKTWSTEAHRRFFNIEAVIGDFTGLWEQERIIKGGLTITTPQEKARFEIFSSQFADRLHFSQARTPKYPDVAFINILSLNVSKGKALEMLASHLAVSLDEVVAVGDGKNDISLLSAAGLAIAMGNAQDEVKKVADHVTLDVEQDGLAAAIKRFLV